MEKIHVLTLSLNQVPEETVQNCFNKGGFLRELVTEEMPEQNM